MPQYINIWRTASFFKLCWKKNFELWQEAINYASRCSLSSRQYHIINCSRIFANLQCWVIISLIALFKGNLLKLHTQRCLSVSWIIKSDKEHMCIKFNGYLACPCSINFFQCNFSHFNRAMNVYGNKIKVPSNCSNNWFPSPKSVSLFLVLYFLLRLKTAWIKGNILLVFYDRTTPNLYFMSCNFGHGSGFWELWGK